MGFPVVCPTKCAARSSSKRLAGGHCTWIYRTITHSCESHEEASASGSNAMAARRHYGIRSELVPDTARPKGWQWFGYVCHRRAGYSEADKEKRYNDMKVTMTIEPCDEECLEGSDSQSMYSCQVERLVSDGVACFASVMGWLLACRQA